MWDGGNNDFPFLVPDLHIVLVDALRPDQVDHHHPGEACLRMADVIVVNKVDSAIEEDVQRLTEAVRRSNPSAPIIRANSPVRLEDAESVRGKRVVVVEDGPTISHGGMSYGAGYVAAIRAGASEIVDPRDAAAPEIAAVFARHPHIGRVLPAMGYDDAQLRALRETIRATGAERVVAGTPIDLGTLLGLDMPVLRARYAFEEAETPGLGRVVDDFLERLRAAGEGP